MNFLLNGKGRKYLELVQFCKAINLKKAVEIDIRCVIECWHSESLKHSNPLKHAYGARNEMPQYIIQLYGTFNCTYVFA